MPNWCYQDTTIYGSKEEVMDFKLKLEKAKENAKKSRHWGTCELFRLFGYESPCDDKELNGLYIRGSIENIEDIGQVKEGYYLSFLLEVAWSPMIDGIDFLLSKFYKTLKEVTLAEESGCGLYTNTDKEGIFYTTRYHFYSEVFGDRFFDTEEALLKFFNEEFNENAKSFEERERLIEENSGYQDEDGDDLYTSVHEY